MIGLFKAKKHLTKEDIFKEFHNRWILEDKYLLRFFSEVLLDLSQEDFSKITSDRSLLFVFCNGQFSATMPSSNKHHIILIYPHLLKEIHKADNRVAKAIIFHELGHIYFNHMASNMDEMSKQIEADSFCKRYGLSDALMSFLSQFNNVESATRRAQLR